MNTHDKYELPPLPSPGEAMSKWAYDETDMQAYARAAIEADRQANQITGETSDGYHTFNELYAHRVRLFCLLMHAHKDNAWWSRKHHDGSAWEGWIIAGIDTPEGATTYHLPESEIENLPEGTELPNGKKWDRHTANDVLVRLLSLRQARGEPVNGEELLAAREALIDMGYLWDGDQWVEVDPPSERVEQAPEWPDFALMEASLQRLKERLVFENGRRKDLEQRLREKRNG